MIRLSSVSGSLSKESFEDGILYAFISLVVGIPYTLEGILCG